MSHSDDEARGRKNLSVQGSFCSEQTDTFGFAPKRLHLSRTVPIDFVVMTNSPMTNN
jgi:hypothetical protein